MAQAIQESYAPEARVAAVELPVAQLGTRYTDLARVLDYWNAKRGDRFAPPRSAIEPGDLKALLPRMKLIDVVPAADGSLDFRFRLSGTEIGTILKTEITRTRPRDLKPPQFGALIHDHYAQCVTARRPLLHRVAIDAPRQFHSYVRLLLPLSSDGSNVDMLLTVDSEETPGE
jgi:hypothetical protein